MPDFGINQPPNIGCTFLVQQEGGVFRVYRGQRGRIFTTGTDAKTVTQAAIDGLPSEGGTILLGPNSTFDLGSAAANGLTIEENKAKHTNFIGSGHSTIIQYTGTGAAIYVTNTVASSSYPHYRIGNFTLTGVASPYSSSSVTVTSNRNGIFIDTTWGLCDISYVWMRNFDNGIKIYNTEFCDVHHVVGKIMNNCINISSLLATNTNSGTHIHDCQIAGCYQNGVWQNSTGISNYETAFIDHCAIDDCVGSCIRTDSYGNEFTIQNCYLEAIIAADEATWGAETGIMIYLAGSSGSPLENVTIKNVHFGGVENVDNAIKVENVKDLTLDDCDAKGFRNAMVLINTTNSNTYMTIRNPKLRAYPNLTNTVTPYLIDVPSNGFLNTIDARLAGTVETPRGRGIIINCATAAMSAGDVIKYSSTSAGFVQTTTTADDLRPGVLMYPNKTTDRPCVVAISGVHKVNIDAATTYGDTLTTSATARKARINNIAVDPKIVLGYAVGFLASAGLQYAQIK